MAAGSRGDATTPETKKDSAAQAEGKPVGGQDPDADALLGSQVVEDAFDAEMAGLEELVFKGLVLAGETEEEARRVSKMGVADREAWYEGRVR